jgi:hypothetical protein
LNGVIARRKGAQTLMLKSAFARIHRGPMPPQETGDRRQETGDRRQETGVRSQESGVRSQESGVRSQESGVRSQESGRILKETFE